MFIFRRSATVAALALTAIVAVTGCATNPGAEPSPSATSSATAADASGATAALAAAGLTGLDAVALIDTLEAVPLDERATDFTASVRPNEVVITALADESQLSLPIPDELFYLSIAPYRSQNHDCYFHSLTTCTGELRGVPVQVNVVDDETGDMLVDEVRATADNGFVGLWLPKDRQATITVTVDGQTATASISTAGDDDLTCLTTLQLS